MKTVIFDLDGTVLDSSHRQITKADGSLDLAHWLENNTAEKILNDKPLPLAQEWRNALATGWHVVVCTAREMGAADFQLLRKHGLFFHTIFSRPNGSREADHVLKREQISGFMAEHSWTELVMFDDNPKIRETISELGIEVFDPIHYNAESN